MSTSPAPQQAPAAPKLSALPIARVARIAKADQDVRLASKEALFLISKATEYAMGKLTNAAYSNARLQKREKMVKYQDLANAVARPEWFFLQDVIPPTIPLSLALDSRKKALDGAATGEGGEHPSHKSTNANNLVPGVSAVKKARKKKEPAAPTSEAAAPESEGGEGMQVDG